MTSLNVFTVLDRKQVYASKRLTFLMYFDLCIFLIFVIQIFINICIILKDMNDQ